MHDLEAALTDALTRYRVPGAAVAVFDGDKVKEFAAGVADISSGEPVTPSTRFRIASITKLFTTTLALQLVAEGRLDLDAPIREVMPELSLAGEEGEAVAAAVTARHLLTHTSGIPGGWFPDCGPDDDCLARFVPTLAKVTPLHAPDAPLYSYGNSGFILLGRMVQVITGDPWEQALAKRIAEPLGLEATGPFVAAESGPGIAVSHVPDPATGAPVVGEMWPEYRTPGPAGSQLASTVGDLVRFGKGHGQHAATVAPVVEQPTTGVAVGLGWMYADRDRRTMGHGGGSCNFLRMTIDGDFGVAFLSNAPTGNLVYRDVVAPLFKERLGIDVVPPPLERATEPVDVTPYAGVYQHAISTVRIDADGNTLRINGGGALTASTRPHVFTMGDGPLAPPVTFLFHDGSDRPAFVHAGGLAYRRQD